MKPQAPSDVDPFKLGFLADPWAGFRSLHEAGGVLWHPAHDCWLVVGYAEAQATFRDEAFAVNAIGERIVRLGARGGCNFSHLGDIFGALPLFNNPPAHAALRRFFAGILTAQTIADYVPAMREIAARLLEQPRAAGGFDAALDYADRMPALFMARLLGIPEQEVEEFLSSTTGVIEALNRVLRFSEYRALDARAGPGLELLARIVAERRRAPRGDAISRMIAAEFDGRSLGDMEIACVAYGLFLVGVETTSTFIGSAIRLLAGQPARYAELRRSPALVKPAVEELLRLESPVQLASRVAAADSEIAGQRIGRGEHVEVLIGAANRDPRAYPDPDRIDFQRAGPPHLAFAGGAHFCLGATLARTEAQIALGAFLELPPCRRTGVAETWWPYDWLRRVRQLPLEFS